MGIFAIIGMFFAATAAIRAGIRLRSCLRYVKYVTKALKIRSLVPCVETFRIPWGELAEVQYTFEGNQYCSDVPRKLIDRERSRKHGLWALVTDNPDDTVLIPYLLKEVYKMIGAEIALLILCVFNFLFGAFLYAVSIIEVAV